MSPYSAKVLAHRYFPDWKEQRVEAKSLDDWHRGVDQSQNLFIPSGYNISDEYADLQERSPTPWLALGISSLAQTAVVDGIERQGTHDMPESWKVWQQNRWDSRQNALYRGAMTHGIAFNFIQPGRLPLTGEKTAIFRGLSAMSTAAWYEYPDDE